MANVVRWNPFEEMWSLVPRDWLARLGLPGETEWSPRCDVTEREDAIVVQAELPGVAPGDMEVTVEEGVLTIRGEKRSERREEEKGRTYSERFFGSFERRIAIPQTVDAERISASLKDGVLEVVLPKREPEPKAPARKIEIRAG